MKSIYVVLLGFCLLVMTFALHFQGDAAGTVSNSNLDSLQDVKLTFPDWFIRCPLGYIRVAGRCVKKPLFPRCPPGTIWVGGRCKRIVIIPK